jgi:hypothetical protein
VGVAVGIAVAVGVGVAVGGDMVAVGAGVDVAVGGAWVVGGGAVSCSGVEVGTSVSATGVGSGALQARLLTTSPSRANPIKAYRLSIVSVPPGKLDL